MVRTLRSFFGITFLAAAVLFAWSGLSQAAPDDDDKKKDDKKSDKKEEKKKLELPKLPEGSKAKWDFEALEEKFTIIKGGINEIGAVYFLLELKEDMTNIPQCDVNFIDGDKVKFETCGAACTPAKGKKGDRVRLELQNFAPARAKDVWLKATTVKFADR
jgi:hypothetical protein